MSIHIIHAFAFSCLSYVPVALWYRLYNHGIYWIIWDYIMVYQEIWGGDQGDVYYIPSSTTASCHPCLTLVQWYWTIITTGYILFLGSELYPGYTQIYPPAIKHGVYCPSLWRDDYQVLYLLYLLYLSYVLYWICLLLLLYISVLIILTYHIVIYIYISFLGLPHDCCFNP